MQFEAIDVICSILLNLKQLMGFAAMVLATSLLFDITAVMHSLLHDTCSCICVARAAT